jgi:ABC-type proline/glycine betaine transport system permease subunit
LKTEEMQQVRGRLQECCSCFCCVVGRPLGIWLFSSSLCASFMWAG